MQELNELKNLVIQSLESTGVLSNIRAEIRASVFKAIDTQDQSQGKRDSNYKWENLKCKKLLEYPEGKLLLLLMKEFFQFYQMDYSHSVFSSEANVREELNKEDLHDKTFLKINEEKDKPMLLKILQRYLDNNNAPQQQQPNRIANLQQQPQTIQQAGSQAAGSIPQQAQPQQLIQPQQLPQQQKGLQQQQQAQKEPQQAAATSLLKPEQQKLKEPIQPIIQNQKQKQNEQQDQAMQSKAPASQALQQNQNQLKPVEKAPTVAVVPQQQQQQQQKANDDQKLLDELDTKKNLNEAQKFLKKNEQNLKQGKVAEVLIVQQGEQKQPKKGNESSHNYEEEGFEEYENDQQVDEDIGYEDQDLEDDFYGMSKSADLKDSTNVKQHQQPGGPLTSSEEMMAASQSQGFDMTVDSLALEEYDYMENIDKE